MWWPANGPHANVKRAAVSLEEGTLSPEPEEPSTPPVPWHFKVMVVLAALYVGWRLVQLIGWLIDWVATRF